jgi:transposase-like protein
MSDRTTNKYKLEFKKSSAKLAVELEQPVKQTARDLGIPPNTLYDWINKFYPNKSGGGVGNLPVDTELKQLKKQVARLTQERDILKKAAAYFASEM